MLSTMGLMVERAGIEPAQSQDFTLVLYLAELPLRKQEWRGRGDSNPQSPDLESVALANYSTLLPKQEGGVVTPLPMRDHR